MIFIFACCIFVLLVSMIIWFTDMERKREIASDHKERLKAYILQQKGAILDTEPAFTERHEFLTQLYKGLE